MSTTDKHRASVPDNLRSLYAPVAREMEAVEGLLQKEFSSEDSFVDRLAQHGFRLGGKRLRPALVLLSAQACGGISPEHFNMAVTTELIHTATLIHDDVLDDAKMRRHLDTVNALWDNEASILLGDYFLARVMCMVGAVEDTYACRTIGEAARRMCEGELRQIESRGNYELDEEGYFRIIAGKNGDADGLLLPAGGILRRRGSGRLRLIGPLRTQNRRGIPDRRRRARPARRRGLGRQVAGNRPAEAKGHAAADPPAGHRRQRRPRGADRGAVEGRQPSSRSFCNPGCNGTTSFPIPATGRARSPIPRARSWPCCPRRPRRHRSKGWPISSSIGTCNKCRVRETHQQ